MTTDLDIKKPLAVAAPRVDNPGRSEVTTDLGSKKPLAVAAPIVDDPGRSDFRTSVGDSGDDEEATQREGL